MLGSPSLGRKVVVLLAMAVAAAVWAQMPPQNPTRSEQPSLILKSTAGEDMFKFYCSSCHGIDGRGRKPSSPHQPMPPDLTRLAAANGGVFPRERVLESIASGRGAPSHLTGDMPRWGSIFRSLDPSEALVQVRIANLVQHIESNQVQ
jgi:mono/diheme cytochrome c family protein